MGPTDRSHPIGAVLVGGAGTRMGEDKAMMEVRGEPLAARAVRALRDAGIADVMLIGGRDEHSTLDGRLVADLWPGDGPVGGVLTALHAAFLVGAPAVVCLACDLPAVDGVAVQRLVEAATAHGDGAPTIVEVDGRRATPNGVWPVRLLPPLEDRFGDGASSFGELLDGQPIVAHDGGPAFADADEPGDLAHFL